MKKIENVKEEGRASKNESESRGYEKELNKPMKMNRKEMLISR